MVAGITLTPNNGQVGDTIVVDGTGFDFTSAITFTYGGVSITPTDAPITSAGDGSFTAHLVIPASAFGAHAIVATDAGAHSDSQNFTVATKLVASPASGKVGTVVTLTGTGFVASGTITGTTFGGSSVTTTIATPVTDANGGFSCTFVIPASIKGNHDTVSTDSATNSGTAVVATLSGTSLSVSTGNVGATTVVTGSGFGNAETVTLTFGGVAITPTEGVITSTSSGAFTATLTIPAGTAQSVQGSHDIVSLGGTSSGTDTNAFTITPKLTVSPLFGNVGDTATVTLTGYAASSALTATFNGTSVTLASSTSTANGDKTTTFTVPKGVDGANTISIHDAVPNTATASFELYLSNSGISMNSTFTHLNGRNLYIKPTTTSREREAIVNIAFDATDEYETGGMPLDFSGIQHFTQVYLCSVVHKTYGLGISFVAGAGNGASLGKLKFFDSSGDELTSGNTAIQNVSLLCRIRGI